MLTDWDKRTLLALARESIEAGFELQTRALLPQHAFSPSLHALRPAFVTLRIEEGLRGCCGSVEPTRALFEEVWHSAASAAFSDPRFPRLRASEWPQTRVHLSVLEPLQRMLAVTEELVLRELRPGVDGLVLQLGAARATFLPSVWEQLPNARAFLETLKTKAGWPADFWSPDMQAWRYSTENFGDT